MASENMEKVKTRIETHKYTPRDKRIRHTYNTKVKLFLFVDIFLFQK